MTAWQRGNCQFLAITLTVFLTACGSAPKAPLVTNKEPTRNTNSASNASNPAKPSANNTPALPKAGSGRGAYYQDDGPGENPPQGLEFTVDPIPTLENYSRSGNKPYVVFGKTYTPITDNTTPLVQRGVGSWYGKKFHGQKTSSGELYDMYKMTAAHPTLPIPSYARVTNLDNGKQVIVRINDRGPFHSGRIIDLSYTAALKLEYLGKGSSTLQVERLLPADIERMAENSKNQKPAVPSVSVAAAVVTPEPPKRSLEELLAEQSKLEPEKITSAESVAVSAVTPQVKTELSNGYYLQFGAFAIRANAEGVLNRIKPKVASRLPEVNIIQQGSLYRLVSGPFASRDEVVAALSEIGDLGVGKPVILQR